jgi:hypothetical protein
MDLALHHKLPAQANSSTAWSARRFPGRFGQLCLHLVVAFPERKPITSLIKAVTESSTLTGPREAFDRRDDALRIFSFHASFGLSSSSTAWEEVDYV